MIWLYSKTLVCGLLCNIVAREIGSGEGLTIQLARAVVMRDRQRWCSRIAVVVVCEVCEREDVKFSAKEVRKFKLWAD